MSLAYSLVNSLAETEPEEDLTTLVIDHYTREIRIPKGITTLGVECDDDVLRLNFKMPRYLGTVDLYNFSIRINYINANGDDDVYKVTDKAVVGDNITFSWLVGPTAVAYKGNTRFNVCMVITDSNSTIKQEYNTAPASLPVKEGLECSERVISEYTDILEQWERRLFGIGDTEEAKLLAFSEEQQENIANKGAEVLATIPEDYQTTYKLANEGVRTKADAIICRAEGETIVVADSSDDNLRGLKIFGKTVQVTTTGAQLADFTAGDAATGVTKSFTNDTLIVSGDGSVPYQSWITNITEVVLSHPGENLYFDYDKLSTSRPSDGTVIQINIAKTDESREYIPLYNKYNERLVYKIPTDTSDMSTISLAVYTTNHGTATANTVTIVKPMLQIGTDKVAYEPYTGGVASPSPEWYQELIPVENPTIEVCGKNLYEGSHDWSGEWNNSSRWSDSGTYNGLSVKTESTFKWSGLYKQIHIKAGLTYTFSAFVKTTLDSVILLTHADNTQTRCLNRNEMIIGVSPEWGRYSITFSATEDMVITPRVERRIDGTDPIYVCGYQLEIGENMTEYEPYHGFTISSDHTLPGIPVTAGGNYTDSNGQQWICDEIDFERGVYVKRFEKVILTGQEDWGLHGDHSCVYTAWSGKVAISGLCSHYPVYLTPEVLGKVSGTYLSYTISHIVTDTRFVNDPARFKAFLAEEYAAGHPVTLLRLLNELTETPLSSDELAAFQVLKSNYPNTTVLNDAGAWMEVRYNADTETWITNLIDEKIAAAVAKL